MNKLRNIARCYLCNCAFVDKKVYEHMFEKRYNASGVEQNTLATILAMVLGIKLEEEQLHSTFVCSTCKVSLLNYEALGQQLFKIRLEILETHKRTAKLYEAGSADQHCGNLNQSELEEHAAEEEPDLVEPYYEDNDMIEMRSEHSDLIESCFEDAELIDQRSEHSLLDADLLDPSALDADLIEHCGDLDTDLFDEYSDADDDDINHQPPQISGEAFADDQPSARVDKSKTRVFACSYCDQVCNRRVQLVEHERIHTGERPYKCNLCEASFAQRANYRTHMNTTHLNRADFKCNICLRSFKRQRLLDNHIKSVHTKLRDLNCEQCEATFSDPISLKKHLLCHTGAKDYSCQICGKQFSRAENRDIHHFVHSKRKPYACQVCGEEFMRKQQLQQHSKTSNHSNPKIVRLKPQFSAANSDKLLQQRPNE